MSNVVNFDEHRKKKLATKKKAKVVSITYPNQTIEPTPIPGLQTLGELFYELEQDLKARYEAEKNNR